MPELIPARQNYLSWPRLDDALRDATRRLHDAEWEGQDTARLRAEVAHLRREIDSGGTYLVPF